MDESPLTILETDSLLQHVKQLARAHDPEPSHCFQVTRVAAMLFGETKPIHNLGPDDFRLLVAAALLHDTGYGLNPRSHHKGSRDFVMKAELPDISERDRRIIAAIARYHRGAHPKPTHRVYADLDESDRNRVRKLAAILRIADGLDRAHDASCTSLAVKRDGRVLSIYVEQRTPSDTDLWGANRKKDLFEEVFELDIRIETAP